MWLRQGARTKGPNATTVVALLVPSGITSCTARVDYMGLIVSVEILFLKLTPTVESAYYCVSRHN